MATRRDAALTRTITQKPYPPILLEDLLLLVGIPAEDYVEGERWRIVVQGDEVHFTRHPNVVVTPAGQGQGGAGFNPLGR